MKIPTTTPSELRNSIEMGLAFVEQYMTMDLFKKLNLVQGLSHSLVNFVFSVIQALSNEEIKKGKFKLININKFYYCRS